MRHRLHGQALGLQVSDNARQHGVVEAFSHGVLLGKADIEPIVVDLVLLQVTFTSLVQSARQRSSPPCSLTT